MVEMQIAGYDVPLSLCSGVRDHTREILERLSKIGVVFFHYGDMPLREDRVLPPWNTREELEEMAPFNFKIWQCRDNPDSMLLVDPDVAKYSQILAVMCD